MPFQYARFGGILEWFDFTMTAQDIIGKAAYDSMTNTVDPDGAKAVAEHLLLGIAQIQDVIFNQTREQPTLIRFFSLPNFEAGKFSLCAAAKIANGVSYLFGNNQEVLRFLAPDGYDLKHLQKGLEDEE